MHAISTSSFVLCHISQYCIEHSILIVKALQEDLGRPNRFCPAVTWKLVVLFCHLYRESVTYKGHGRKDRAEERMERVRSLNDLSSNMHYPAISKGSCDILVDCWERGSQSKRGKEHSITRSCVNRHWDWLIRHDPEKA